MNKETELHCKICKEGDKGYKHRFGNIFSCLNCSGGFRWPQPSAEYLESLYQEAYYTNPESARAGYDDYVNDRPNISKTFKKRLATIEKTYNRLGKLLDLGCATGFFLEVAAQNGWDVHGLDISRFATDIARKQFGDKITTASLQEANYSQNHFDVITGWDYIEHVPDPASIIRLCHRIIKPNGLLVLSTPDFGSWPASFFGEKWMGIKEDHLFYFTKPSVKKLLEQNGFSVVQTQTIGKYVLAKWFIRRLGVYSPALSGALNSTFNLSGLPDFPIYINPLDIIMIIAKADKK